MLVRLRDQRRVFFREEALLLGLRQDFSSKKSSNIIDFGARL